MCGIVGVYSRNGAADPQVVREDRVEREEPDKLLGSARQAQAEIRE